MSLPPEFDPEGHHSITIVLPGGHEEEMVQLPFGFAQVEYAEEAFLDAMRDAVQRAYNRGRESHHEELMGFVHEQKKTMGADLANRRYADRYGRKSQWSAPKKKRKS